MYFPATKNSKKYLFYFTELKFLIIPKGSLDKNNVCRHDRYSRKDQVKSCAITYHKNQNPCTEKVPQKFYVLLDSIAQKVMRG